jgi:outer membrane lipoprotein-sorting protein
VTLAALTAAAQEPALEQILAKSVAAAGGSAAIQAVNTVVVSGKMVMGGGKMEAPVVVKVKRPNWMRTEVTFQGQSIVQAFDGTVGWTINPMAGPDPQKMDAKQAESLGESMSIEGMLGSLEGIGKRSQGMELVGKEDLGGGAAYKIKVTRKSGAAFVWVDAKTFLMVKSSGKTASMGQELEVETFPGDYKKVGELLFAHSMEQKANGRTLMQMTFDKVEINTPLDDAMFKLPVVEKPAEKK